MVSTHGRQRMGVLGEGVLVGLVGAGIVAAWFLVYDVVQGAPFRTPSLLGAALFEGAAGGAAGGVSLPLVLKYTLVHVLAFMDFGWVVAGLFAMADREPVVLFGAFMLLCCFQVAFVALLKITAEWALEPIPWWAILIGNFLATIGMLTVLFPRHAAAWRPWLKRRDPLEMDPTLHTNKGAQP
jgi:hypothetical protein